MIISTILASQKLEEFQMIKTVPMKAEAASTLPPHVEPILTLFPPEVEDGKNAPASPQQILSIVFMVLFLMGIVAGIVLGIWK